MTAFEDPMTEAQFAQQLAYLAKSCAEWSASMLTLPENFHRTVDPHTVKRFTDDMRKRLDHIEEWAAGKPPEGETGAPDA